MRSANFCTWVRKFRNQCSRMRLLITKQLQPVPWNVIVKIYHLLLRIAYSYHSRGIYIYIYCYVSINIQQLPIGIITSGKSSANMINWTKLSHTTPYYEWVSVVCQHTNSSVATRHYSRTQCIMKLADVLWTVWPNRCPYATERLKGHPITHGACCLILIGVSCYV